MRAQRPGHAVVRGAGRTRKKAESVAFLAHDLRTSLHVIVASADLLLDGIPAPLPSSARQGVERIRAAAGKLASDVDDLLRELRMAAGCERARITAVNLSSLLNEVATDLAPLCAVRGLSVECTCDLPRPVLATDRAKLRRVLTNLLANAIKYTDSGSVGVHARQEGEEISIRVTDTGRGIAPEDIPYLFLPYWRGGAQDQVGSGLGLAIASGLVALLGGSIRVESTVGSGSVFELRLPGPTAV